MRIAANIARNLLGLVFALAGIAGVVNNALYGSHWMWFVAFVQLLIAASFLTNRFVPVALIMLAAFLYNSFAYHLLTSPMLLPIWFAATVLWLIVALPYRELFEPIFKARLGTQESPRGNWAKYNRTTESEGSLGDSVPPAHSRQSPVLTSL